MISPKYFLFGLSGIGVTAGSLAAWQLTKRTKPATTNSTVSEVTVNSDQNQENLKSTSNKNVQEPQSYQNKIYEECGGYSGLSSQDDGSIMNRSEKNPKGKNYDEGIQCLTTHQQAYNTK